MSNKPSTENILLANRKALTARQSMEALISFARSLLSHLETKTKKYTTDLSASNTADC